RTRRGEGTTGQAEQGASKDETTGDRSDPGTSHGKGHAGRLERCDSGNKRASSEVKRGSPAAGKTARRFEREGGRDQTPCGEAPKNGFPSIQSSRGAAVGISQAVRQLPVRTANIR